MRIQRICLNSSKLPSDIDMLKKESDKDSEHKEKAFSDKFE